MLKLSMGRWRHVPLVLIVFAATGIGGCGSDSNLRTMPDYELSERYAECLERKPTAPGRVQACENMRRECERRREELGTFVCSTH